MNKKAFSTNQLFIYASSLIVLALILYIGVQSLGSISNRTCNIEKAELTANLQSSIRQISTDFGSRRQLEISLPCSADMICIASTEYSPNHLGNLPAIALDSWQHNVSNVFVFKDGRMELDFKVPNLEVGDESGVICSTSQRVAYRLEGTGRQTKLTLW